MQTVPPAPCCPAPSDVEVQTQITRVSLFSTYDSIDRLLTDVREAKGQYDHGLQPETIEMLWRWRQQTGELLNALAHDVNDRAAW